VNLTRKGIEAENATALAPGGGDSLSLGKTVELLKVRIINNVFHVEMSIFTSKRKQSDSVSLPEVTIESLPRC
jgi:hypothetical protein